jgi:hypothetical protein
MIESFRRLVEYSVFKFANLDKNGMRLKDHTHTRGKNVVMDSDLIRQFLELLERKFQSERSYEFKHELKRDDGNVYGSRDDHHKSNNSKFDRSFFIV